MSRENLWINQSIWKDFSEAQTEAHVDAVFRHYRKQGFPFFPTDDDWRKNELRKLKNYDFTKLRDGSEIRQTMHGLALCWSFMPHSWAVRCNKKMPPMELFNDDEKFREVIRRRMKIGDNLSDNGIRKMMKIFTNAQSVSNFRPTAAACIYSHFLPDGGVTWDMSSGFGGRLVGSSLTDVRYVGTDPSKKTYAGLKGIAEFMKLDAEIHCIGSEDFVPAANSLDFCFTSPPYFDTERYSTEKTQSYIRFPKFDDWITGYMRQTIRNCHIGLAPGKVMAINIANVKHVPNLEDAVVSTALDNGFSLDYTMHLALSHLGSKKCKHEPIYIFRRKRQ